MAEDILFWSHSDEDAEIHLPTHGASDSLFCVSLVSAMVECSLAVIRAGISL